MRERLKSFRMPLNRKHRRTQIHALDRLDDTPPRHRHDAKALADRLEIDRLVVSAVNGGDSAQDFSKLRIFCERNGMKGVFSVPLRVLFASPQERRNMLDQFTAERDVENLDAATDSENGLPSFHESLDEPTFELIAVPLHAVGFGRRRSVIPPRVNITSTREQQSTKRSQIPWHGIG